VPSRSIYPRLELALNLTNYPETGILRGFLRLSPVPRGLDIGKFTSGT